MDIKNYIASGILELYALDQLDAAQRREVEQLVQQYPALQEELTRIEAALFDYIAAYEKDPPADLESKILQEIENTPQQPPAKPTAKPSTPNRRSNRSLYFAIAALTLAFLGALYFLNRHSQNELEELQEQLNITQADCAEDEAELQRLQRYFEIAKDPDYIPVAMVGTDGFPGFAASVFTDANTQQSYLSVDRLPAIASNEQFQLWGIVNGQPVSMGVFDVDAAFSNAMQTMDFVATPQAYAVTIEPRGGSETPTLERMVVIGEV